MALRSTRRLPAGMSLCSQPPTFLNLDFLCPVLARKPTFPSKRPTQHQQREAPFRPYSSISSQSFAQKRSFHAVALETTDALDGTSISQPRKLPQQCPGCGAFSQTLDTETAGYYYLDRKAVQNYMNPGEAEKRRARKLQEEQLIQASLQNVQDPSIRAAFEQPSNAPPTAQNTPAPPMCDRCHNLIHHQKGASIQHPSIESLRDTIAESPHKYNHVYHVIDAADFPMSLIPGLQKILEATPQRSRNRRAKIGRFYHDRKIEVSFIIARSDLLAPLKEQVDAMMPYLTEVLRKALGSANKDVRLGNVRCVSAKRGWWTKELKDDIWRRGGGGWMVGKVNVGKSQLFETIFPKGRKNTEPFTKMGEWTGGSTSDAFPKTGSVTFTPLPMQGDQNSSNDTPTVEAPLDPFDEPLNTTELLPPAPQEVDYPSMPIVSDLPGTTASPIRLPFGNGRGELIDLPGLARGDLELLVQEEHRRALVMRARERPEQMTIRPGQSLLIGGFIRITPTDPDLFYLAYAFTPIEAHVTSTEKAIGIQTQTRESGVENIALPGVGDTIASAGTFKLERDVTKKRSGPITRKDAAGLKVEQLPYQVLGTDILIEGCGWVELVAQVRKKRFEVPESETEEMPFGVEKSEVSKDELLPGVEVFSPGGKHISSRPTMCAWVLTQKPGGNGAVKSRPRPSMKGRKKQDKVRQRAKDAQAASF